MEVILKKDYEQLGYKGDIVSVKPGFGRNYLIPMGVAVIANKSNKLSAEQDKKQSSLKQEKMMKEFKNIAEKLDGSKLTLKVKSNSETGKIFGSVTNLQIREAIKDEYKVEIDPKSINAKDSIKSLGDYELVISLAKNIDCKVNITIASLD